MAPLQGESAWSDGTEQCQSLYDAAHIFDDYTLLVSQRRSSQGWIRSSPFFLGGSLKNPYGETRTFWLSGGANPSLYTDFGLVSGLAPIGRTLLRIKNAIKDGDEFDGVVDHAGWVRAPSGFAWQPAGPIVDYVLGQSASAAKIERCLVWEIRNGRGVATPLVSATAAYDHEVVDTAQDSTVGRTGFGLGDVLASLDSAQLTNVDLPDDGPLFITGAAGTGKTTVAFYRASYLLEEQRAAHQHDSKSPTYFEVSRMLVLVRREHLKPYLARLAQEVGLEKIPVKTFDDWFQWEVFRPYLNSRGADGSRSTSFDVRPEPRLERWTGVLTEEDVSRFLGREFRAALQPSYEECVTAVTKLRSTLQDCRIPDRSSPSRNEAIRVGMASAFRELNALSSPSWVRFATALRYFERLGNAAGQVEQMLKDSDLADWVQPLSEPLEEVRRTGDRVRRRLATSVFRFDQLAKAFYSSVPAEEALRKAFPDEADEAIKALSDRDRPFSRADDVAVAWLIHKLTEEMPVDANVEHLRPLPQYDHIILDEAQFYPPALVRLLRFLARSPRKAITVVGDLEQRSSESGLTDWQDLVSRDELSRIKRLDRIYRASREVYEFLMTLNERLGLGGILQAPREFDRFSGEVPQMALATSNSGEVRWLSEAVSKVRERFPAAAISVVVPLGTSSQLTRAIVDELNSIGVPCREAHGEDIGERLDRVLVTDSDSVVGLEFDAVFLPFLGSAWPVALDRKTSREFWICATRAKRFLGLSSTASFPAWFGEAPFGGATLQTV